jgi:hypothetical protein
VSNKGVFSSALSKLVKQYATEIAEARKKGQVGEPRADWGFLYGEFSVGQSDFEKAFFVAVEELKKRAGLLRADAIIGMRKTLILIRVRSSSFTYRCTALPFDSSRIFGMNSRRTIAFNSDLRSDRNTVRSEVEVSPCDLRSDSVASPRRERQKRLLIDPPPARRNWNVVSSAQLSEPRSDRPYRGASF